MDNHNHLDYHSTLSLLLKRVSKLESIVQELVNYANYSSKNNQQFSLNNNVNIKIEESRSIIRGREEMLSNDDIIDDDTGCRKRKQRKLVETVDNLQNLDRNEPSEESDNDEIVVDCIKEEVDHVVDQLQYQDQEEQNHDDNNESGLPTYFDANSDQEGSSLQKYQQCYRDYYNNSQTSSSTSFHEQEDNDNSSVLQLTQTTTGNLAVIYKGHLYRYEKAGVNKKMFRCRLQERLKCTARLHTNEFDKDDESQSPQLLADNGFHNHDLEGNPIPIMCQETDGIEPEDTADNASSSLQLIRTVQGNTAISYKGYIYHFVRVGSGPKKIWRCKYQMSLKCSGRLHTNDFGNENNDPPKFLLELGAHNHDVDYDEKKLYLAQKSLPPPVPVIINSELTLTKTQRQKSAILYQGHTYRFSEHGADNKKYWRCCYQEKTQCRARIHTNDFKRDNEPPKLLQEVGFHNHNVEMDTNNTIMNHNQPFVVQIDDDNTNSPETILDEDDDPVQDPLLGT